MILFRRLLPSLLALLVFGGFQYLFRHPTQFWIVSVSVLGVVSAGVLVLHPARRGEVLLFAVAPILFIASVTLYLLFPERQLVRHVIAFAAAVGVWIYCEQLFAFRYRTANFQAFALEHIAGYLDLASVFLSTAGLHGLRYSLGFPLPYVILLGGVIQGVAASHALAMAKVEGRTRWVTAGFLTLLGFEVLWVATMLPAAADVVALLTATFYFSALSLAHYALRSSLDREHRQRYILLVVIVVLFVVLTSRWR